MIRKTLHIFNTHASTKKRENMKHFTVCAGKIKLSHYEIGMCGI